MSICKNCSKPYCNELQPLNYQKDVFYLHALGIAVGMERIREGKARTGGKLFIDAELHLNTKCGVCGCTSPEPKE